MQNEDVKLVSITPVAQSANINDVVCETVKTMNSVLNDLGETVETPQEKKAKSCLEDFSNYIKTQAFKSDVNSVARKHGIPPKKVAVNFFEKTLGTVGDILGIGINVVCNAGHMIINIATTVAQSIINLIHSIASGLVRLVTLNRTCVNV